MFATYAGGYSRRPLPAQPDVLGDAERAAREGRLDEASLREVADAFVREVLEEMAVVGLGIVGDGGVRAPDRSLPLIGGLEGVTSGEPGVLPDGEPATVPLVTGPVRWRQPITVADWQYAAGETDLPAKQTILGPYTLACLTEAEPGRRRDRLAREYGEALNQELGALAGAGCPMIEIDEPFAMRIGDNEHEWRTFRAAGMHLTANVDDASAHLSLGLWGGQIHPAGHAHLLDLPYRSYLVDVLAGPTSWRFISAVPPDRGVVVGCADSASEALDETECHIWAMAWAAQGGRGSDRVGCAPNGPLWAIGRHFAHRKCLRLAEAVNIGRMGPLQEVAADLDEDPSRSRIPALRAMALAVAEARGG